MTTPFSAVCPSCGASASGNFCSNCGGGLKQRVCANCQAELSEQARFCHHCGRPAGSSTQRGPAPGSDRKAWTVAGVLCVLLVGGIAYKVSSAPGPAVPDMANAGSSTGTAGPAPDISGMTPRERFDRLYDRIMRAAGAGDSAEVRRFTPMALGAYAQLDARDIDSRYHAAMLHTQIEEWQPAMALADTILAESPGHLFGYVIRGEVGRARGDSRLLGPAQKGFLANYESAMRANRVEYLEHKPALDEFRERAEKTEK